jgi:hypothetical protein
MCSNKNAPTGMMPLSECSRRNRNSCPWPARSGATPVCCSFVAAGAADGRASVVLTVVAIKKQLLSEDKNRVENLLLFR